MSNVFFLTEFIFLLVFRTVERQPPTRHLVGRKEGRTEARKEDMCITKYDEYISYDPSTLYRPSLSPSLPPLPTRTLAAVLLSPGDVGEARKSPVYAFGWIVVSS